RDRPPPGRRRDRRPLPRRPRAAPPGTSEPHLTTKERSMPTLPIPVEEAPVGERPAAFDDEHLVRLYADMIRVRAFEEEVVDAFRAGLIPGSTHPCIGQEAI